MKTKHMKKKYYFYLSSTNFNRNCLHTMYRLEEEEEETTKKQLCVLQFMATAATTTNSKLKVFEKFENLCVHKSKSSSLILSLFKLILVL